MATQDIVSLNVPQDTVKVAVEKAIQTAIIQNLQKSDQLVEQMVHVVLSRKVDSEGNFPRYDSDAKYDWLDWLVRASLKKASREALETWLEEKKEEIKAAILKELSKPQRAKTLIKAFADAAEKSFAARWNFTCNIDFKSKD